MRKLVAWGLEVALVVGLGATVARADDAPSGRQLGGRPKYWKKSNNGWAWQRGSDDDEDDEPADKAKPDAPAKKPAKDEAKPDPKPEPEVRDPAAERSREEAVFLRRSAVCLKLQEVALKNNDTELMKKAEQLRERAWSAYTQRTAELSGATSRADAGADSVERFLSTSGKDVKLSKKDAPKVETIRASVKED